MFHKTIEAVRAAQAAAQAELDELFVPYDKETGGGGFHWHAAGSGILQNAIRGLDGLASELEKRQVPIDEAQAAADAAAAAAGPASEEASVPVVSGGSTDDPTPAPEPTPTPGPEPAPDPTPAPEPEAPATTQE